MEKITKEEVAEILDEIGLLLELKGENPFKTRAYTNAARTIGALDADLGELVASGELKKIKGIGAALTEKITELVTTGKLTYYEDLRKSIPEGLFEMIRVPGLGPKRAKTLHDELDVSSLGELEYACRENRLVKLDGFGAKMQEKILSGILFIRKQTGQHHFPMAETEAQRLYGDLKKNRAVQRISIAGSLRRRKEVVKDVDLLISAKNSKPVMTAFTGHFEVEEIIAKGDTKSSVRLKSGINADLRVVSDKEFPFALHHFTGSKEHNVAMRGRAQRLGYKMNEYGLFKGKKAVACRTEEDIFEKLGLSFIPPEMREDRGEIESAERKTIPALIVDRDIRGIFHNHTLHSDGSASVEEMVKAARAAGYDYIGLSDHSRSAGYAGGLDAARVRKQHQEIDAVQKKFKDITIFKGIESDILKDGSLDYPDKVLASFDFVIASVHSNFNLSRKDQTARVIKAVQNPYTTMLGHPTGRLLLTRDGFPIDLEAVIEAAADFGVVMELNANPMRLDLDWRILAFARERKVPVSINPDAHSIEGIGHVRYGVGIARKGWLTKKDVFNAKTSGEVRKALDARRR